MTIAKNILGSIYFIFGALIFLAILTLKYKIIPSSYFAFLEVGTFVSLVISLALSLYFGKSKFFSLLLGILFFFLIATHPLNYFEKFSYASFWHIAPLFCSILFVIISFLDERGIFSRYGAIKIALSVLVLAGSYLYMQHFSPSMQKALQTKLLHVSLHDFFQTNDFRLIVLTLCLGLITLIAVFTTTKSQKAIPWIFTTLCICFLFFQSKNAFILFTLVASIIALCALIADTYDMAYMDTLTGVPSRRSLEESLLKLGQKYVIAMVDIDFFKKVNDTFGHDIGDDVLKLIASQLCLVKNGGRVFRYGGEEFAILFFNKKEEDCVMALEAVRKAIYSRGFTLRKKGRDEKTKKHRNDSSRAKKEKISISIGVASAPKDGNNPEDVIKKADIALFRAKENGRNQIVTCSTTAR
ncbi:MAG: GGDEF domain-containing protein [Sulfurospirillaceae bacterium]|nr:GGDEF domain-containing protein [Sulfurospirillaceae bacterium]